MKTASHFSQAQISTLARLARLFPDETMVLVGASAVACWIDMQWRGTGDLDITITVAFAEYSRRLDDQPGWNQDPKMEHRWKSPDGVLVDILPASDDILKAGTIKWPSTGSVMNMVGFRLALELGESVAVVPDGSVTVAVAPLRVLAVLKFVAYQDRPQERLRDLADLAHILTSYLAADDDRNYDPAIWDAGLEGDQASAFALGIDVRGIVNAQEEQLVESMIDLLIGDEEESSTHLLEMAVAGPLVWHKQDKHARRAVDAFARGFHGM